MLSLERTKILSPLPVLATRNQIVCDVRRATCDVRRATNPASYNSLRNSSENSIPPQKIFLVRRSMPAFIHGQNSGACYAFFTS